MKLRTKIIVTYIILIVITTGVLGFIAINKTQEAALKQEEEKIEFALQSVYTLVNMRQNLLQEQIRNNLNVSVRILKEEYGNIRIDKDNLVKVGDYKVPAMYAGDINLIDNTIFVDEVAELLGGTSTIFTLNKDKFVRVSTNVLDESGGRAIGTVIDKDSPVYQSVINGKPYYSRAWVVNRWCVTAYRPLLDSNNNVVGMLYVGVPEIDENLEGILRNVKIGDAGHLYIMDSAGDLLYHPTRQGENIAQEEYVQDILEMKNGTMEFVVGRNEKIANFQYFEPWDWYVVALVNIHDIKSNGQGIINFVTTAILVILIIATATIVNKKVNIMEEKEDTGEFAVIRVEDE